VANLLCFIELQSGRALPVSLEVLGQGRRVASQLGATLYAVVALPRAPTWSEDDLVTQLAAHGADKVVIATDEALGTAEEMRWGTHGTPLAAVCDLLSPSLLLFGLTPTGREVAARAAARMGAAYLADAWIEADDGKLRLFEGAGVTARALDDDLEFAVVATVPPGRYARATGDDEAEVEVVATSSGRPPDFEEIGVEAEAGPCAVVVADAATRAAAARLATALGGVVVEALVGARLAGGAAGASRVAAAGVEAADVGADGIAAGGGAAAGKKGSTKESGVRATRAKPKSGRSARSSSSSAAKAATTKAGKPPSGKGLAALKAKAAADQEAIAAQRREAAAASDGAIDDDAATVPAARLAITLGPPCPAAERRVRLGGGDSDADYVVDGDAAMLAGQLARALGRGNG
jgi:electron transfer flavoprotein alpha subunit